MKNISVEPLQTVGEVEEDIGVKNGGDSAPVTTATTTEEETIRINPAVLEDSSDSSSLNCSYEDFSELDTELELLARKNNDVADKNDGSEKGDNEHVKETVKDKENAEDDQLNKSGVVENDAKGGSDSDDDIQEVPIDTPAIRGYSRRRRTNVQMQELVTNTGGAQEDKGQQQETYSQYLIPMMYVSNSNHNFSSAVSTATDPSTTFQIVATDSPELQNMFGGGYLLGVGNDNENGLDRHVYYFIPATTTNGLSEYIPLHNNVGEVREQILHIDNEPVNQSTTPEGGDHSQNTSKPSITPIFGASEGPALLNSSTTSLDNTTSSKDSSMNSAIILNEESTNSSKSANKPVEVKQKNTKNIKPKVVQTVTTRAGAKRKAGEDTFGLDVATSLLPRPQLPTRVADNIESNQSVKLIRKSNITSAKTHPLIKHVTGSAEFSSLPQAYSEQHFPLPPPTVVNVPFSQLPNTSSIDKHDPLAEVVSDSDEEEAGSGFPPARKCIVCLKKKRFTENIFSMTMQHQQVQPRLLEPIEVLLKNLNLPTQLPLQGQEHEVGLCFTCGEYLQRWQIFKSAVGKRHEDAKSNASQPSSIHRVLCSSFDKAPLPFEEFEGEIYRNAQQMKEVKKIYNSATHSHYTRRSITDRDWDFFCDQLFCFKPHREKCLNEIEGLLHSREKLSEIFCITCQKLVRKGIKGYVKHIKIRHPLQEVLLPCDICGNRYPEKAWAHLEGYFSHWISHFCFNPCKQCDRIFATKDMLAQHCQLKHIGIPSSTPTPLLPIQVRPWKCNQCEASFHTNAELVLHDVVHVKVPVEVKNGETLRIHESNKSQKCDSCGKTFITVAKLKRHQYRIHQKGMEMVPEEHRKCHPCGKTFITKEKLKRHQSNVHQKQIRQKSSCYMCGKTFPTEFKLKRHQYNVHQKVEVFVCSVCGKQFKSKSGREDHSSLHTGEMKYRCKICDNPFRTRGDLSRHMKTHKVVSVEVTTSAPERTANLQKQKPAATITSEGQQQFDSNIMQMSAGGNTNNLILMNPSALQFQHQFRRNDKILENARQTQQQQPVIAQAPSQVQLFPSNPLNGHSTSSVAATLGNISTSTNSPCLPGTTIPANVFQRNVNMLRNEAYQTPTPFWKVVNDGTNLNNNINVFQTISKSQTQQHPNPSDSFTNQNNFSGGGSSATNNVFPTAAFGRNNTSTVASSAASLGPIPTLPNQASYVAVNGTFYPFLSNMNNIG